MSQQMPSYARPLVAYILSLIDKVYVVRQLGGHHTIPGGVLGPHHTSHENAGSDEISVAGLSGELADAQPVAVQDEGVAVATRAILNFIGSGVVATLDGTRVNITISGGAGIGDLLTDDDGDILTDDDADLLSQDAA